MAITAKVVDASALACFCFGEPERKTVLRELTGVPLFAPAIIEFEMANICWKRMRRAPGNSAAIREQFAIRKGFPITIRAIVVDQVLSLAVETGLTAYDASYLWLARDMRAGLVTLDEKLARAAAILPI